MPSCRLRTVSRLFSVVLLTSLLGACDSAPPNNASATSGGNGSQGGTGAANTATGGSQSGNGTAVSTTDGNAGDNTGGTNSADGGDGFTLAWQDDFNTLSSSSWQAQ